MSGPIYRFLVNDHRRIESWLGQAAADPETINLRIYAKFRAGLLRHIGMEEKILIPEALRNCRGAILIKTDRIRLDHGALAALLVPPPSRDILSAMRAILAGHNLLEEGTGGLYETCEPSAGDEQAKLLERLRAFPTPRLRPHVTRPDVLDATRRALSHAGYDWDALTGRSAR